VPSVSQFYGIVIYMYYNDHAPPHFHAVHGNAEALFSIGSGGILAGTVPRRVSALVAEWASLHREALEANWELARQGRPLRAIPPLA
jgi:hypothetical protein